MAIIAIGATLAGGVGITTATGIATGAFLSVGWGTLLTVASVAYQLIQAKKMKAAANAAAEARKGMEAVIDASIAPLPIVYGRALVGGVRVFSATSSVFKYTASNASKTFSVGPPASPEQDIPGTVTVGMGEGQTIEPTTIHIPAMEAGLLNKDILDGTKNEFLFTQQAVCQGPINKFIDVLINGSMYLDDPTLGTYSGNDISSRKAKAALRIDCHNTTSEDAIMSLNFGQRMDAKFSGAAHASAIVRLDRDNPQFQGVPSFQFLIEGRKVKTFIAPGVLSSTLSYSTNPALCLLDYLTDVKSGSNVAMESIDLMSFYNSSIVCDKVVLDTAKVGGKIWQPTDKAFNIQAKSLPLYECNIAVDTSKPIRDNVESILSTMGDARLVWSQGKYKLLLQYPETNELIDVAATLTDDDLIIGDNVEIQWPSNSDKLNNATIKFHNEAADFKEDSVSWPPRTAGNYSKGIGGSIYPVSSGNWDASDKGQLLTNYGVWSGSEDVSTLSWKFIVRKAGTHTIKYTADNSAVLSGSSISLANANFDGVTETTFTAAKDDIITIQAVVTNEDGPKAFAGHITDSDGRVIWSTRSPAYTDFIQVTQSSAVYDAMLAEDRGVLLETDVFAEGITDYYHALAKAEELVRTSRTAFTIKFKYLIKDRYFEPGDIIKLDSVTLGLEELFIRVTEAKVVDGLACEISGSRFDYSQLAWNVADDAYFHPKTPYNSIIPAPAWVHYSADSYLYNQSSGTINWENVSDSRVVGYIIYAHKLGDTDTDGFPNFVEVGRSAKSPFELPPMAFKDGLFGVRSYTSTGAMSKMTLTTDGSLIIGKVPPQPTALTAASSLTKAEITLNWTIPNKRADDTDYDDHAVFTIWRSKFDDRETAVQIGESTTTTYIDLNEVFEVQYYWVEAVSLKGVSSKPTDNDPVTPLVYDGVSSEFNHFDGSITDDRIPPAPFNLVVTGGYSYISVGWTNPTHWGDGSLYKLHKKSRVYAYKDPMNAGYSNSNKPNFALAHLVGDPEGSSFVYHARVGERWWFWVREVSIGNKESTSAAGPEYGDTAIDVVKVLEALTGQITSSQLHSTLGTQLTNIENGVNTAISVANDASSQITTVATTANNASSTASAAYAAVQTEASTRLNADNTLFAQYTVKLDVNGYVAGFGLVNDGATSDFQVRADRFSIASPGAGSIVPFIVQSVPTTISGQYVPAGVYMNDAYIRNGTIVNAKIGHAAVDTLTVAGNAITVPVSGSSVGTECTVGIILPQSGTVVIHACANSAYVEFGGSRLDIQVDGVTRQTNFINSSGGVYVYMSIPALFQMSLSAGYHTIRAHIYRATGGTQICSDITLSVMGTMR